MKTKPKISIIVPAYNEEKNISKCIESILSQEGSYELIVVNDGSEDDTEKKVMQFNDERLKYFFKKNSGLSDTRNYGISKSNGDYLMFVDADDWIEKDSIEVILTILSSDYDVIKFDYNIVKNSNIIPRINHINNSSSTGEELLINLINNKVVFEMAPLYLYNRKGWIEKEFEFEKGRYHEDFGLIPKILLQSKRTIYLNKIIYNYNHNSEGIIRTKNEKKEEQRANDIFELGLKHLEYSKDHKFKENKNKIIFESFVANAILSSLKLITNKRNKKEFVKKVRESNIIVYLSETTIKQKLKKIYYKTKYNL